MKWGQDDLNLCAAFCPIGECTCWFDPRTQNIGHCCRPLQGGRAARAREGGRGELRGRTDGRTRVTERDKKSTGSSQNCHINALSSFYGMSEYQDTVFGIMMMTRSEFAPLPASRSRFTVFQRRSERQHLQLAITSRAGALPSLLYNPEGTLPPSASNKISLM